jgi:outer membrane scaffolding protein for murein synthesis (MipA/OmpV family)
MRIIPLVFAAAAAAIAAPSAIAAEKPLWEIGIGAFGTYSPIYRGSDKSEAGGFPVVYISYRGKTFSILSDGLFDVDADSTEGFDFGLSFDFSGSIDSEDRLFLGDSTAIIELGPRVGFALFADGTQRLEANLAVRAAYLWDDTQIGVSRLVSGGFAGAVIEPELAYKVELTDRSRMGIAVSALWATDDKYADVLYGTSLYRASGGYLGTDIRLRYVNDLTDRFRLVAQVTASYNGGAENRDSPLFREDWGFSARLGFTYALVQSAERAQR